MTAKKRYVISALLCETGKSETVPPRAPNFAFRIPNSAFASASESLYLLINALIFIVKSVIVATARVPTEEITHLVLVKT